MKQSTNEISTGKKTRLSDIQTLRKRARHRIEARACL